MCECRSKSLEVGVGSAVDDDAEIVLGALRGVGFDQGGFGVDSFAVDAEDFVEEILERVNALCFV